MIMQELSESRLEKNTDQVERFLIKKLNEYFEGGNDPPSGSVESIINEAVRRAKEEIDFDGSGVTSISLPGDIDPRKGDVNITLDELGGEPKIDVKKTAFNVDFGTAAGTACEGNDPRLSDARTPTAHTHTTSEITGLDSIISSLQTRVDQANLAQHSHSNMAVLDKLIYTGSKNYIDLKDLELIGTKLDTIRNNLNSRIDQLSNDASTALQTAQANAGNMQTVIGNFSADLTSQYNTQLANVMNHCDSEISAVQSQIQTITQNAVSTNDLTFVINNVNSMYRVVSTYEVDYDTDIETTGIIDGTQYTYQIEIPYPSSFTDIITNRQYTVNDYEVRAKIESNGYMANSPLLAMNETGSVTSSLSIYTMDNKAIIEIYASDKTSISDEITGSTIIFELLGKGDFTL